MAYRAMHHVLAQCSGEIEKDLRSYLLSPQEFMSKKVDETYKQEVAQGYRKKQYFCQEEHSGLLRILAHSENTTLCKGN